MFRRRKFLAWFLMLVVVATGWLFGSLQIARQSIEFDLRAIARSVYEARQLNGRWPVKIADLEGTEYLNLPYRKSILEEGNFIIHWPRDLEPEPSANRDWVLAHDNCSVLPRFGRVWVIRGDLTVEHMPRAELRRSLIEAGE